MFTFLLTFLNLQDSLKPACIRIASPFHHAASYLSSLPEDSEEIISTYSSSAYQDRSGQNSKPRTPPLSIVLYVLCANLHRVAKPATPTSSLTGLHPDPSGCASSANSVSCKERMECLRTMKVFSQLLDSEDLPEFVQERLVVQVGFIWRCVGQYATLALHSCWIPRS